MARIFFLGPAEIAETAEITFQYFCLCCFSCIYRSPTDNTDIFVLVKVIVRVKVKELLYLTELYGVFDTEVPYPFPA